jgi:hypothetical protein
LARFGYSAERAVRGVLPAEYQEKLRCLHLLPVFDGGQSMGSSGLFAVCPFTRDKNHENAFQNAKHNQNDNRHIPPALWFDSPAH